MSGMKKTWKAMFSRMPRAGLSHEYIGNTLVNVRHKVELTIAVTDGPQAGRELRVWMTVEAARMYATEMILAAAEADKKNREAGCRD